MIYRGEGEHDLGGVLAKHPTAVVVQTPILDWLKWLNEVGEYVKRSQGL
jgi:hypothetical protein